MSNVGSRGIRRVSVHTDEGIEWVESGGVKFSALFYGGINSPDAPVGVFVKADRDVGDLIAGKHSHDTPTMIIVIDGAIELDGDWLQKGDMSVAESGVCRGDLVVGPYGATFMTLFAKRSGIVPTFADQDDQAAFDETMRDDVTAVARGEVEKSFALLPARATYKNRRGVVFNDIAEVDVWNARGGGPVSTIPGTFRTNISDDGLPFGKATVNARTAIIVLGEKDDPEAPAIGVINVKAGPGDRIRSLHIHTADAINLVIEGAMYMDGQWIRAGEAKIVDANLVYGDGLAGPDGFNFLEIWSAQSGLVPVYEDPEDQAYAQSFRDSTGHLMERLYFS